MSLRSSVLTLILCVSGAVTLSCGGTDPNIARNANLVRKIEEITASSPTRSLLSGLERSALDARKNADKAFWRRHLDEAFVSYRSGVRRDKISELALLDEENCQLESYGLSEETMVPVGLDAVILTSKADIKGSCSEVSLPNTVRLSTLFVRSGSDWKAAYHNEVAVGNSPGGVPAQPKTPAKAATPEPSPSAPLAVSLTQLEQRVRSSIKARAASDLQTAFIEDISRVDSQGNVTIGKSAVIDELTSATCKITRSDISAPQASQISPVIAVLTYKATVEGSCNGRTLRPVWGTSIFHKTTGDWRIAYIFETPA